MICISYDMDANGIIILDDIRTPSELNDYEAFIREADPCTRRFSDAGFRNGKVTNCTIASQMFERVRSKLPEIYRDAEGVNWRFVGACRYVMFAELNGGQLFDLHTDTGSEWDTEKQLYSKFTLLIYLNDDFEGGECKFFDNDFQQTLTVFPKCNRTLIFDIARWHKGCQVQNGTKRWIGTELVCTPSDMASETYPAETHVC